MIHLRKLQLLCTALTIVIVRTSPQGGLPDGVCSVEGQACDMHDNVVAIINNVPNMAQCRVLCQDESTCTFATFYGSNSFPFSDTCVLLSSCEDVHDCMECVTEDSTCTTVSCTASGAVESHIGDNLIQFLADFDDEKDCRAACVMESRCTFYTHHNLSDPAFPGACFLLSNLQAPLQPCNNCMTGPRHCGYTCSFLLDGDTISTGGLLLTNTSSPIEVLVVALGVCQLMVVAVGGGGHGYNGAAGGSGYIEWNYVNITGSNLLEVKVGGGMESSEAILGQGAFVKAQPGGNGNTYNGGNGYSGGGGSGFTFDGSGGKNGGDGNPGSSSSNSGGKGSGVNVANIPLTAFALTPGNGGSSSSHAGGGGGVLVDGKGPSRNTNNYGQGYGGGGQGGDSSYHGNSGVILISYN